MSLLQPSNRNFVLRPHLRALALLLLRAGTASVNLRPVNCSVVEAVLTRRIVLCNFGILRIVRLGGT
jgi:hypothetical protein